MFKTGAVFEDHFFQHEMEVIAKAMELITAFNAAGIIKQKGEPYFSLVFPAPSYLQPHDHAIRDALDPVSVVATFNLVPESAASVKPAREPSGRLFVQCS